MWSGDKKLAHQPKSRIDVYRLVPLYPNTFKSILVFVRSIRKMTSQSLMCCSARWIQTFVLVFVCSDKAWPACVEFQSVWVSRILLKVENMPQNGNLRVLLAKVYCFACCHSSKTVAQVYFNFIFAAYESGHPCKPQKGNVSRFSCFRSRRQKSTFRKNIKVWRWYRLKKNPPPTALRNKRCHWYLPQSRIKELCDQNSAPILTGCGATSC